MSSKHILRDIKEDFDWEDYIDRNYDVKRTHGKNGLELRICCPSCGEMSHKCYINPERAAFFCFKCDFRTNRKYDLFDLVALTEGISKGQAVVRLLQEYKPLTPETFCVPLKLQDEVTPSPLVRKPVQPPSVSFIEGMPEESRVLREDDSNPFWQYVKSRGFTAHTLAMTKLHYVPSRRVPVYDQNDKYRGDIGGRILFPVYGPDGQLVSWLGRSVPSLLPKGKQAPPKYFNCPDSDLSRTLWPYSEPYGSTAILVEGIIDACGVRQVPKTSAYATFGKRVSAEQIQLLKHWGVKNVVLWYDKKDAFKEMVSEVERLKMHFEDVFVLDLSDWPVEADPGTFLSTEQGPAMIESTLSKRISAYSFEYGRWKTEF